MKHSHTNIMADGFDIDVKAEVIAAELIEDQVAEEEIMIVSLGGRKRTYSKDVGAITEEVSDYNNKDYVVITTHKEGLYDMLPEGLFHSPTSPKTATSQKEITDSIKKRRVEERNARRFFLPFESASYDLRVQMALFESRIDKGSHHDELVNIFSGYWDIFKYLDTRQSDTFLQVLPLIHQARDNYDACTEIFEMILAVPVRIKTRRYGSAAPGAIAFSILNDAALGIDFTTGNCGFNGSDDDMLISIGPIDTTALRQFMPGEPNYRILYLLCDYLLPVHVDILVDYELLEENKTTRLADKEHSFNAALGLSTFL